MLEDSAQFGALVDDGSRRRWRNAYYASALLAALVAVRTVASWDVWWHLAIGREAVVQRGRVLTDSLSYSFFGQPYVHNDVVADALFFVSFDQLGFAGLALVRWAALLIALVGIRQALGRHGRPLLWLMISAAFLAAVQSRVIPRPLVFTIAFFPLMIGMIERARRQLDEREWAGFFVAMLPAVGLQWAWLNLHRGGLIGLVLLLGHAFALALAYVLHRCGPLTRIAGRAPGLGAVGVGFAVFVIAVGVGLLNPNGPDLYRSGLLLTQDAIHRTQISEWQALTWETARTVHPFAVGLIACAWLALGARLTAGLLSAQGPRARVDVWHAGVLLLFTYQGIASMRWLTYASAAAAVILGLVVTEIMDLRDAEGGSTAPPRGALAMVFVVSAALLHLTNAHGLGLGVQAQRYPDSAMEAADRASLGPNVHNSFVYGGYVTWYDGGRYRTLIDGRNDMVFPSEFFLRCTNAQHDLGLFAELWHETGGDWVLAENTAGREAFRFLATHPDWMMIHWSEEAVVYVIRGDHPEQAELAFTAFNAADPMGSLRATLRQAGRDEPTLTNIRRQLMRALLASPRGLRANAMMAMYLNHMGPTHTDQLRAVLDLMQDVDADHPAVVQLRRELLGE